MVYYQSFTILSICLYGYRDVTAGEPSRQHIGYDCTAIKLYRRNRDETWSTASCDEPITAQAICRVISRIRIWNMILPIISTFFVRTSKCILFHFLLYSSTAVVHQMWFSMPRYLQLDTKECDARTRNMTFVFATKLKLLRHRVLVRYCLDASRLEICIIYV
jgi:hypothetical protein